MSYAVIKEFLNQFFIDHGISSDFSALISLSLLLVIHLILGGIIFWVTRKLILKIAHSIAEKTKSQFDDLLTQNKFPKRVSYLVPLFYFHSVIPNLFESNEVIYGAIENIVEAATVVIFIALIRSLLNTIRDYLKLLPAFKDKPIDSYIQVVMIFLWFIGIILILSILTGKDVVSFLTTIGALSAVLLFVFKDSILGFVASVQITINDTVRIGDWITMKNSDADGDVVSISLSTVQVQNFDKTITSIPTYKLVSDSFVNWRGMSESEGRRIKRSLLIKVGSIRFLSPTEVKELEKIEKINRYIKDLKEEIERYNDALEADTTIPVNGRNMTNLGVFRNYTEAYLKKHPKINQNMTVMCRQLAPSPQGIPIEIYAFISDKEWVHYEHISADIFDHLLAVTRYFHLECFEYTLNPPAYKA
ncbi:mechanosensitive ion channel family protein [Flavobacteriaceae bacterium]|nr:mechanosensitive ion channel family protein [Flavobacteriaceae bacterium]